MIEFVFCLLNLNVNIVLIDVLDDLNLIVSVVSIFVDLRNVSCIVMFMIIGVMMLWVLKNCSVILIFVICYLEKVV